MDRIAMAYVFMACAVMAYMVMAYIVMAYIVMACIAMAYITSPKRNIASRHLGPCRLSSALTPSADS